MIIVGSNMGLADITNAHLGLCLIMKIPLFVVLTKIDIAPKNIFEETIDKIKEVMRNPAVNRIPVFIKKGSTAEEIAKQADLMLANRSCPIFCVSSVKMEGI
jgi:elongation factor 1-alpha